MNGFEKFLKRTHIIGLSFLAAFFYFGRDIFIYIFLQLLDIDEYNRLYSLIPYLVYIILAGVWILLALTMWREEMYNAKTGRHYSADHGAYHRTYGELVRYFQDADPHKLDTTDFPPVSWKNYDGIVIGHTGSRLVGVGADCESNIAVFGPPGTGKTSGFAIINALRFPGSVLAIDIKGDIYNFVRKNSRRKIIRFCPDHPDALRISAHFDPLAGIMEMDPTDRKLYLQNMATVLIPDEGGSDGNYFSSRARKFYQGIVQLLLHQNAHTSFPDIVHSILSGNPFDWVNAAIGSDCIEAKEQLSSFYGNSEKNVSGVYDALCNSIIFFSSPVLDQLLRNNGRCISINTLEKGADVYLQITQEHLNAYAPLFTLIIQSFSTSFTKRPDSSTGIKNRPILMLLDEFPQLTFSYDMINSNLSTLRSKSVITTVIMQNLSQCEYRYQPAGARSIVGNCNYQLILGSNDPVSSKSFSDLFGDRKILKSTTSESKSDQTSVGRSSQEAREPIFFPNDFGDLKDTGDMIVYFAGKHCRCKKFNCYKDF